MPCHKAGTNTLPPSFQPLLAALLLTPCEYLQGLYHSLRRYLQKAGRLDDLYDVVPATYHVHAGDEVATAGAAPSAGSSDASDVASSDGDDEGADAEAAALAEAEAEAEGDGGGSDDKLYKRGGRNDFELFVAHFDALEAFKASADGSKEEDGASRSWPPPHSKLRATSERHCRKNLWIVKPAHLSNRGAVREHSQHPRSSPSPPSSSCVTPKQGIFVADDVQRVQRALAKATRAKAANSGGRRCREWIVQKYLERPMLVAGRKFDIRCFVLLVATRKGKQLRGYLYKVVHMRAHPNSTSIDHAMPVPLPHQDGYIRTSSKKFTLGSIQDRLIHLTNDAVQKHSAGYGKFEAGNKMSYIQFGDYLESKRAGDGKRVFSEILPG